VEQLRDAFDVHQAAVDHAAADAAEAKVQHLQSQLEQAQTALETKEAELASAHALLNSAGQKEHEELLRLQVGVHKEYNLRAGCCLGITWGARYTKRKRVHAKAQVWWIDVLVHVMRACFLQTNCCYCTCQAGMDLCSNITLAADNCSGLHAAHA
jgi:hypothetical protein